MTRFESNGTRLNLCGLGLLIFLAIAALCGPVYALDQANPKALPNDHPDIGAPAMPTVAAEKAGVVEDRRAFEKSIDLDRLRTLVILHQDQLKILDSWARQSVSTITHKTKFEGHDPLYTTLDMAFRPQVWNNQNIVYVRDVPLRRQLAVLLQDPAEQARFLREARVSPMFLSRSDVQLAMQQITDVRVARSAGLVYEALDTFVSLQQSLTMLPPPQSGSAAIHQADTLWHLPLELAGNLPKTDIRPDGGVFPSLPGYEAEPSQKILDGFVRLRYGWQTNDVQQANAGIATLAEVLPTVNPEVYRTSVARTAELWYGRTFNGTVVALIYFLAMTLFVNSAVSGSARMHKAALGVFSLAVGGHLTAMGVRWWLAGRIPIQNEFESILGAALLGCLVGWVLEWRSRNSLYGAAMAFVGAIAMTACYVFPFVIGEQRMGAEIATVSGILGHNIWLYIHVNIVIWSYALIAGSFALGLAYLGTQLWHWLNPLVDAAAQPALAMAGSGGGAEGAMPIITEGSKKALAEQLGRRQRALEQIDTANMVVLQLAFWMLGTGIICGAIWADVSWGRPWGWDAKETFALVTWIVYLIIVHMRFVLPRQKGSIMAWLSIVGFAVMLFNWVGVNFFLVGLHSYA